MLQSGVFVKLLREIIINASGKHGGRGVFLLLVLLSRFTVKSASMLWNLREYCRMAFFPKMKSCYLKRNDQMLLKWLKNKAIRLMFWPGQKIFSGYLGFTLNLTKLGDSFQLYTKPV